MTKTELKTRLTFLRIKTNVGPGSGLIIDGLYMNDFEMEIDERELAAILAQINPHDGEWWYFITPDSDGLRRAKYGSPTLPEGLEIKAELNRLRAAAKV